jgi:general secretion pathway protein J
MTAGRHRERGFTLLELLVAITLLGLLMAALFGALRLGARVWETGEARLDASARVQVAQDFLRQQLSQTVPLAEIADDPGDSGAMLFDGASARLRFVSLLPEHLGAGASLIELALNEPAQGGQASDLVIRLRPLDLSGNGEVDPRTEERVLIEGIESLEINYFGAEAQGGEPVWWREWQGQRSLPRLIRVRVGFPQGDGRSWPELIVGLMVDLAPLVEL